MFLLISPSRQWATILQSDRQVSNILSNWPGKRLSLASFNILLHLNILKAFFMSRAIRMQTNPLFRHSSAILQILPNASIVDLLLLNPYWSLWKGSLPGHLWIWFLQVCSQTLLKTGSMLSVYRKVTTFYTTGICPILYILLNRSRSLLFHDDLDNLSRNLFYTRGLLRIVSRHCCPQICLRYQQVVWNLILRPCDANTMLFTLCSPTCPC